MHRCGWLHATNDGDDSSSCKNDCIEDLCSPENLDQTGAVHELRSSTGKKSEHERLLQQQGQQIKSASTTYGVPPPYPMAPHIDLLAHDAMVPNDDSEEELMVLC